MTIDQAVLLVQQGGNLGDVILNPPQPRVSINLPLPVVVPGSQRGACTRADLDGRKDLIHYELKDIGTRILQKLKVVCIARPTMNVSEVRYTQRVPGAEVWGQLKAEAILSA